MGMTVLGVMRPLKEMLSNTVNSRPKSKPSPRDWEDEVKQGKMNRTVRGTRYLD